MNLNKREISQLKRGGEDVVQAQKSGRVVPGPNEGLGERTEARMVGMSDRFKHSKL